MFAKTIISFLSVIDPSFWTHGFFVFLRSLTLSLNQFTKIFALFAQSKGAWSEPKLFPSLSPKQTFHARPTVFLQLITPSGFSVTVRALLDSGSSHSFISTKLAALLIENDAIYEYFWPTTTSWPFMKILALNYRKIVGLKLQSVENKSATIKTSIIVDESFSYHFERLPDDLVVKKMAFLGLPLVQSRKLERTMWSKEKPKYVNFIENVSFL